MEEQNRVDRVMGLICWSPKLDTKQVQYPYQKPDSAKVIVAQAVPQPPRNDKNDKKSSPKPQKAKQP